MIESTARPPISIVLPVYNGERSLAEAIESCLAQTYPVWELIAVDDASTDGTAAVLSTFAARDPRIRVIRHTENLRLPAALNTGFHSAQGALLTWTSDDNRYHPAALQRMAERMEANLRLAAVYCDYDLIGVDGSILGSVTLPEPPALIRGDAGIPCFLWRRQVWEQVGDFSEDLFLAEDYEYWLRILASRMPIEHLPERLYQYCLHDRSLTDLRRGQTFLAAERALLRHLPAVTWNGRAARGDAWLYLASLATWRGDLWRAARYTLHAMAYTPLRATAQVQAFMRKRVTDHRGWATGDT
jgi:glycosyltransferase involved in cell wall biosynthesis